MTQECTLVIETEQPIPFACADGTGIEKGAILKMDDTKTAILSSGDGDVIAGIAAAEKIANDGNTTIPVYRGGIFKGTNNGGSTVGDVLYSYAGTGADNDIKTAPAGTVGGAGLGIAFETASNDDTFLFELRPGVMVET